VRAGRSLDWNDLTHRERVAVVVAATVQLSLLAAALIDLRRRPAEQVRGDKRLWALASFVNFVGPLSYFGFGIRR
jgi:hypothetical protein